MTRPCPYCGHTIPSGVRQCMECGAPVGDVPRGVDLVEWAIEQRREAKGASTGEGIEPMESYE